MLLLSLVVFLKGVVTFWSVKQTLALIPFMEDPPFVISGEREKDSLFSRYAPVVGLDFTLEEVKTFWS